MTVELLSNSVAAATLAELSPEKTEAQWLHWLQNNRNQSRSVPYRVPFERMAGGVFYRLEELVQFLDWEKSRQLGTIKLSGRAAEAMRAFGVGEPGGGSHGRQWKGGDANLANSQDRVSVQVIINEPLLVFSLTPEEALEFASRLVDAGNAAKQIASDAQTGKLAATESFEVGSESDGGIIKRKPQ